MDAATKAATALQKAQATAIYAGLGLWPKPVMARLVAGQLAEDGIYPDAGAAFEAAEIDGSQQPVRDYSPDQPRDPQGRWTEGGSIATEQHSGNSAITNLSERYVDLPSSLNELPSETTSGSQSQLSSTAPTKSVSAISLNKKQEENPSQEHRLAGTLAHYAFGLPLAYLALQKEIQSAFSQAASVITSTFSSLPSHGTSSSNAASPGPGSSTSQTSFPDDEAQLKHIFRNKGGHLQDTMENRKLLFDVANDPNSILGTDKRGNVWSGKLMPDGSQVWVQSRNGRIINGGSNSVPKSFDPSTGLSSPVIPKR